MDTNRIIINNNDLSTTSVETATGYSGYTVVNASAGPCRPVLIPSNSVATIQDIFGKITKENSSLYEAQTFNTYYDTYISAPYSEAKVPVAFVTTRGIFPAKELVNYGSIEKLVFDSDIDDEEAVHLYEDTQILEDVSKLASLGVAGGTDLTSGEKIPTFENNNICFKTGLPISGITDRSKFVIKGLSQYIPGSTSNLVSFSITKSGEEYIIFMEGAGNFRVGTLDVSDTSKIKIKIEGNDETPLTKSIITSLNNKDIYQSMSAYFVVTEVDDKIVGAITYKYPSNRPLHIEFGNFNSRIGYIASSKASRNILKIEAYMDEAFHDSTHPIDFTGSLDPTYKNGNGANMSFSESNSNYMNQNLIFIHSRGGFGEEHVLENTGMSSYTSIVLDGGYKKFDSNCWTKGWEEAKKEEYSNVDIFFDSNLNHSSIPDSVFLGLSSSHPLAGYIFNQTIESVTDDTQSLTYGANYWNICNEAIINYVSTGAKFYSPITGARAAMQMLIIESRYGGVAPMYLNSGTPSVGGQLSIPYFYKLRYKYDKDVQEKLDGLNYNPVIRDRSYGVMLTGQKTCKGGELTDWSYIGHVSSFLTFQKEIKINVMIPQLGKTNSPYYRSLRKDQVQHALDKRLTGNNRIWAEAIVDTSTADGVNDEQARRARKFLINVYVKTEIFSEYVVLNFTNVDQGTILTE